MRVFFVEISLCFCVRQKDAKKQRESVCCVVNGSNRRGKSIRNISEFKDWRLYVLVEHQIRGEVKQSGVDFLVGPPAHSEHHHRHP